MVVAEPLRRWSVTPGLLLCRGACPYRGDVPRRAVFRGKRRARVVRPSRVLGIPCIPAAVSPAF